MTGTLNKRTKYWFVLEQSRSQVWFLPPDVNWATAWILTHFISAISFLAFAFHLYLGDKSFGPGNLQMDVCICALLKNTLWFWCINYFHDFFSALPPIALGTVQTDVNRQLFLQKLLKYDVCSCQTHKQVITAQWVAYIRWGIVPVHRGTLSQE